MTRYNLRMLRGGRVVKKKEGERIKRWKVDYERFINNARNYLPVEEVMEEIVQTFVNNAIEQEKVSLICPLTKERIVVPVRYRTCHHLQCFDLKGFLAMKAKRNFLECPICNTKVENELTGLRIDKYFEKLLFEVVDANEVQILRDGFFTATVSRSASIVIKQIDDEEPYVPESTTHIPEMKSETVVVNVEEVDRLSSSHIDSEPNESDAETQTLLLPDTPMPSDINQAAHSNIAESGTNMNENRHKCGHCSYASNNNGNLLNHSRTHSGEKPYKCSHCSFSGASSSDLNKHSRTHTGEKPYKCNHCSFACAQLSNLKLHMRIHTGEKPYKCSECSFACAGSSDLKKHMHSHTGKKPYKCSQCSYATTQAINLKLHIRTHTGEKPYKCNKCSFTSAYDNALKAHMQTHTGEKPHKCSQCSFAAARTDHLKKHMLTHSGEKPYKCSQCSFTSARSSNLITHMRTHTGEKPYKCSKCSYVCARSGNLKSHMRTHI